ncbi:MAG: restriction endonuclease subunit S [Desulfobacula sp.]|nr:restriction endonuclease subunit S [Desulfobacula sp.]
MSDVHLEKGEIPLSKTTKFIVDNRGKTAPTENFGISLIATNCVNNRNLYPIYENIRFVSQDTYDNWFRAHPRPGDILLTLKGSQNGAVCLVPDPVDFVIAQDMVALRADEDVIDPLFLFAALRSADVQAQIKNLDVSGVIPHLKKTDFDKLLIPYPNRNFQRLVGKIYFDFSAKIDLLHRQNKTLEAMAETLFRQWFVEEAQEDWMDGCISDLCLKITKGTTPTTLGHQFTETGVNFIKAESITDTGDFIWDKFAKISTETHEFLNRSMLQEGDILCSIAGTIGRVAIASEDILPANTNQAIAIIRINPVKCYPEFLYLFMKSNMFQEIMDGKIVHAVQPNLSLGEIGSTTIKIPQSSYMLAFKGILQPIFRKKKENYSQIRTLEKLRDTLLPKLMSGEVRVEYEN